jgi:hypothetical protein
MSDVIETGFGGSINWNLIANYFRVLREYQCQDKRMGLSVRDIQYFETSNPKLFFEMEKGYRQLGNLPDQQKTQDKYENFLRSGRWNLHFALFKAMVEVVETRHLPSGPSSKLPFNPGSCEQSSPRKGHPPTHEKPSVGGAGAGQV